MQGSLMCFLSFWCIFLLQLLVLVLVFTSVVFCEPWLHFYLFFYDIFLFCSAFGLSGPDFFWTRSILLYVIHVFHHILKGSVK